MEVVVLHKEAFYALFKKVVEHLEADRKDTEDKWIDGAEVMSILRIKSTTTLQKLRDEGKIRYPKPQKKIILYDREWVMEYIEKHARETF